MSDREAKSRIKEQLEPGPYSYTKPWDVRYAYQCMHIIQNYLEAKGIIFDQRYTNHCLRHTIVTVLTALGYSETKISKLTGNNISKNIKMVLT